jgi:hypothetical protein
MAPRSLLPATNVTAPAMPGLCIGADFAILRNCMADDRLNSPDRQTMVALTDYRVLPNINRARGD